MNKLKPPKCIAIKDCAKELLGDKYTTFVKLYKSKASWYAYCNKGILEEITTKPAEFYEKTKCPTTVPPELIKVFGNFCPAAEKIVALSWITGLSSIILAILWIGVIV